jgi:hypothetical protein
MNAPAPLRIQWFLSLLISVSFGHAQEVEDTYETLRYGTNVFTNVRIIQASPVDLLIGHENGHLRIPLQKLPEPLKSKYPHDEAKAAEYKKQQAEKARVQYWQDRSVVNQQLLAKEAQTRQQIERLQEELKRLNKNIATQQRRAKGKGARSSDRQQADEMRRQKLATRDRIWKLQDELKQTEELRQRHGTP